MVREKFAVRLTPEERNQLEHMVRAGKGSARVINRARILLMTGEGWSAPKVAQALDMAQGTVFNVKRRFAEGGLDGVLKDRPQAHRYRKMDDRALPGSAGSIPQPSPHHNRDGFPGHVPRGGPAPCAGGQTHGDGAFLTPSSPLALALHPVYCPAFPAVPCLSDPLPTP